MMSAPTQELLEDGEKATNVIPEWVNDMIAKPEYQDTAIAMNNILGDVADITIFLLWISWRSQVGKFTTRRWASHSSGTSSAVRSATTVRSGRTLVGEPMFTAFRCG